MTSDRTIPIPPCVLRPDLVDKPWAAVLPPDPVKPLPTEEDAFSIFQNSGRALAIIGDPGAGKTVFLLRLVRDLIVDAENKPTPSVPVVLHLATWLPAYASLDLWLFEELHNKYRIDGSTAKKLLHKKWLILLLDGLDEVRAEHRSDCARAINHFVQDFGLPGFAITCRTDEYCSLSIRLRLGAAIQIQPLTSNQITEWVKQRSATSGALRFAMLSDDALWELARTPLMLRILGEHNEPLDIIQPATVENLRNHLLEYYIRRILEQRPAVGPCYTTHQIRAWLRILAANMIRHGEIVFLIEQLQPTWLQAKTDRLLYTALSCFVAVFTVIVGVSVTSLIGDALSFKYKIKHPPLMSTEGLGMIASLLGLGLVFGAIAWFRIESNYRRTLSIDAPTSGSRRRTVTGIVAWTTVSTLIGSALAEPPETAWMAALKGAIAGPVLFLFWRWLRITSEVRGDKSLRTLVRYGYGALCGIVLGIFSSLLGVADVSGESSAE